MNRRYLPDGSAALVPWTAALVLLAAGCGGLAWSPAGDFSRGYAPALYETTAFGPSELEALAVLAAADEAEAAAEEVSPEVEGPARKRIQSAGPRVGLVIVTGNDAKTLKDEYDVAPVLTVVGWQFEYQYAAAEFGPVGLVEFVPLIAGMEQSQFIPTVNVLVGMRTASDNEFGIGANISPGENVVGLTVSVGKTFRADGMSLPMNFAVVSVKDSLRISFTMGWNMEQ